MPTAIAWIFRGMARIGKGWTWPVLAVLAGWLIESITGAVSWGLVHVGMGIVEISLDFLDELQFGQAPDWAVFGGAFLELASASGAIAALGILVAGGIARFVVKIVTLGKV